MTKDKSSEIHIGKVIIKSGDFKKPLDVITDSKPYFWWSCKIANRKMRALAPATP